MKLLLTKAGYDFAMLQNPVLDGPQEEVAGKFSAAEVEFLLLHIGEAVPEEAFAYRAIMEAVKEGKDTPEKLDNALKRYIPKGRQPALTQSFLSSQRSGAVSRMADLGLIERQREGQRVTYVITEAGQNYLQQIMAN
jgi:hypothetical protein